MKSNHPQTARWLHLLCAGALLLTWLATSAQAATPRSFTGTPITENFDGLGVSGTVITPLVGWDAGQFSPVQANQPGPGNGITTVTDTSVVVDDGTIFLANNTASIGNLGTTGSGDRALGGMPKTASGDLYHQLAIKNDSGSPITSFILTYTGEQWANAPSANADSLTVWFSDNNASSGFVTMGSGFTFTALKVGGTAVLDGNAAANRAVISGTFTPASPIAAGNTFYIRWYDRNDSAQDHVLAIDDLSFALPIPPSAPWGLKATAGDQMVSLTWAAFPGATNYIVKRSEAPNAEVQVGTTTGTSYMDSPLVNGTTYYYVVSAVTNGAPTDNSLEVSATPSAVDAGLSTVVAYLPQVWADGIATAKVTVTLKNGGGNPAPGKSVSLASSGSAVITTNGTGITDGSGVATFTVKCNTAGEELFTATDVTSTPNIVITQQGSVIFKTKPADLSVYIPGTIPGSTVTVLKTWDATSGWGDWSNWDTGNSVDVYTNKVCGTAPNGPRGAIYINNTSTSPGLATLSYYDSGIEITYIGASHRIAANAATFAEMFTWDGDISGQPRQGFIIESPGGDGSTSAQTVQMFSDGNYAIQTWPNTDLNGLHTMTLLRLANGNVKAYVDGNLISTMPTVDPAAPLRRIGFGYEHTGNHYIAPGSIVERVKAFTVSYPVGSVDTNTSTVAASPAWIYANGSDTSKVTVTLKDTAGNVVAGKQVTLSYTGPGPVTITPSATQTTGISGKAVFTVKSTTAGVYTFTATDNTDGNLVIRQTAIVTMHSVMTWGAATDDTLNGGGTAFVETDVKTNGTFAAAVTTGIGGTLNGVTFQTWTAFTAQRYITFGASPISMAWAPNAGRNQNNWGIPSNAYGSYGYDNGAASNLLLTGGGEGDSPGTITLGSLVPNHPYQVQIWAPSWNQTLSTTVSGITLRIGAPPTSVPQYVVGTFTGDSSGNQMILWSGIAPCAISLRDLTPPAAMAEIVTFTFPDAITTTIDHVALTIDVLVPHGTIVNNVGPTYTVAGLAQQDPTFPSGSARDFTTPKTYTIKSGDNTITKVYTVTVNFTVPPVNDNFADAINLPGNSGTQTGTGNVYATLEPGEPDMYGANNTVWFKWTCATDGFFTISTLGSTDLGGGEFDSMLGIYTGDAVGALTALPGTPRDTGVPETMSVAVTAGTTYHIQVAGWNSTTAANILLNWSFVASAGPISVGASGSGALTFDTLPNPSQWSTLDVAGGSGDVTDDSTMDAAMSSVTASSILTPLAAQANNTAQNVAIYRSDLGLLETRVSGGNKMTLLMATLQNTSGSTQDSLKVAYTMGLLTVTPGEQIPGHRVYWSKDGVNWTAVGDFTMTAPGSMPVSFDLTSLAWANGGLLYIVWADDNGANPDGDYTIDNVSFTKTAPTLTITGITGPLSGNFTITGTSTATEVTLYESAAVAAPISAWNPVQTNAVSSGTFSFSVPHGSGPAFFRVGPPGHPAGP